MRTAPAVDVTARRTRPLLIALAIGLAIGLDACSKVDDAAAPSCAYGVAPTAASYTAGGGSGALAVSAAGVCAWTVTDAPSWVTISGADGGKGNGSVAYSVAANPGPDRSASLTVAGLGVSLTQSSASCAFTVDPLTATSDASGGSGIVNVTTTATCAWMAANDVSWISITGTAGGTGNGALHYVVGPNSGSDSRTGTLTIAGRTVTISQAGSAPAPGPTPPGTPCAYSISPASASVGAGGGTGSIVVSAPAGCAWSSSSGAPWMTVTGSSAGGSGTANYTVQPSAATASRTGTLTVAGQGFTLVQAGASATECTYSITPGSTSVDAGGGPVTATVSAPPGCAWTTLVGAPWVSITGSDRGAGTGSVTLTVAANDTSAPRSTTVSVADQLFTINQSAAQPCTYTVAPASVSLSARGDSADLQVTSGANCAWTATTNATWITLSPGASGTGNGVVHFTAAPNAGPEASQRTGVITIAGQTVTVTQSSEP